jgi:hypothetical protein
MMLRVDELSIGVVWLDFLLNSPLVVGVYLYIIYIIIIYNIICSMYAYLYVCGVFMLKTVISCVVWCGDPGGMFYRLFAGNIHIFIN